jgi:transcriptional regulator with XRE-family HTH domain
MRLRETRKQRGLTQIQLSELAGVEQGTISRLENGESDRPSWEIVARLARALDVPPEELFPIERTA